MRMVERNRLESKQIEAIAAALHEMCQPLTALQCRLELGGIRQSAHAMREDIGGAMDDCARMMAAVSRMRAVVAEARGGNVAAAKRPSGRAGAWCESRNYRQAG
jgi:signal transduction histidine kinase